MIISEHFHCVAVCKGNNCDFIENDTLFSIYHKFRSTEKKKCIEKMNEYYIYFTSRSGTLNDFVRDIYLRKKQMLQVIDDELTVVYEYEGQCNLSFDPDLLRYLSEMNMHLLVSCYTLEEES